MAEPFVEMRYDELSEHVAVIDAIVQATPGASRASVMRQIVAEAVKREVHRSTVVMRVWNANGTGAEMERKPGGRRAT